MGLQHTTCEVQADTLTTVWLLVTGTCHTSVVVMVAVDMVLTSGDDVGHCDNSWC